MIFQHHIDSIMVLSTESIQRMQAVGIDYARNNGFFNIRVAEKHLASAMVDYVTDHYKNKIVHA